MLRAEGLRHTFGPPPAPPVRALDDVTFTLPAGRTLVVFGPNGAGKTTLLKVLAGVLKPQAGRADVAGGRRAVGWIGHQSQLYGQLTVRENLLFWGSLYGLRAANARARAGELMSRLGLAERAEQVVRVLSRGLVQRAAIARALMHAPQVLLLDEPFTGLDLVAAGELRRLLGELVAAGRAIVLATHNVEEGAELATDVAFMRAGRFVECAPRGGRGAADIAGAYRRAVSGA